MNIRLATHDDIKAVSTLFTEFFAYNAEQQPEYYAGTKEDGKYPASIIDSNNGDIIVAEIDSEIVGFAHVEEATTPPYPTVLTYKFAIIVDLIVNQQNRRNGVGHLLLEGVLQWAK